MAIVMVTVFLSSCEKDRIVDSDPKKRTINENQKIVDLNIGELPSKEIKLFDKSKQNSITLKVSTTEADLLELYNDEIFEVDFRSADDADFASEDVTDNNSNLLHDNSIQREKVFIEISELNLRNNMTFSLSMNVDKNIALRAYNIERWYKANTWNNGLKVSCTSRGIDGLSAYGYDSPGGKCGSIYSNPFHQKYFYNQNSSSKNFWSIPNRCMWVKTVGYYNDRVSYL